MSKISGVYLIRNTVTGMSYVGSSMDIKQRWAAHRSKAKHGSTLPIHAAMHEFGIANFEFQVLLEACENLPYLELQYILENATFYPNGYNVGATTSGFMPKGLFDRLPKELQAKWKANYKAAGQLGIETLRLLREDSQYEADYLAIKSKASAQREVNILERRKIDPEYDAKERARRANSGKQASIKYPDGSLQRRAAVTFKERFANDSEFAKQVSENRARAAKSRKSFANTEEAKQKMRLAKLGKPQSPEHIAKRLASIKAKRENQNSTLS